MLNYLVLSFLIIASSNELRAELSPKLVACKRTCECPAPYLPLETNYKTYKSTVRLAQCGLDLSVINKNMDCLQELGLGPSKACTLQGAIEGEACFSEGSNPIPATYLPTMSAPRGCGYKWKGFSLARYKSSVTEYIATDKIECAPSMCTSAAFLSLVSKARELYKSGKLSTEDFEKLTVPGKKGYVMLNSNAEPNELVEAFGLGAGHVQYIDDKELGNNGVPKPGDLVQIWRKNESGHSVVFKGFVDENKDGEPDMLCYWSSQKSTKGYGDRCETINTMDRILIGHFK